MVSKRYCDRCGREFSFQDENLFSRDEYYRGNELFYEGKDICAECSIDIEMIKSASQKAAIENISIGEAFKKWLERYGEINEQTD